MQSGSKDFMHSTHSSQDSYNMVIFLVNIWDKSYSICFKSETGKEGELIQGCVIKLVIIVRNWVLALLEWASELSISRTKDESMHLPAQVPPWSWLAPWGNLLGLQVTAESKRKKRVQVFQVWLGSSIIAVEEQISLSHFNHLALSFLISTSVYISRYNPVALIKPVVICIYW